MNARDERPTIHATEAPDPPTQAAADGLRRLHPFFRDLGVTLLAQAGVALAGLLLYRLLAINTGTDGFASYSLVKQAVGFLFPVITVGLVGGLPRYLAIPRDDGDPTPESYVAAAALIMGTATAIVVVLALLFREPTAALFFGDSDRTELVAPFVALMAATSVFYVSYGWYRGRMLIGRAGLLQVLGMAAVGPTVVLLFPDDPIDTLILRMAAASTLIALLAVARPLFRAVAHQHRERVRGASRTLFGYGRRRVPGELAQLGLFVLIPVLAAHTGTLTDVAYLTAGQQVLSVLSLAVLPLGLILLPSLARMWVEDRDRVAGYVGQLAAFACHVALFLTPQALLFADIGVRIWLGSGFDDAGAIVRVTVAPAALFVVYVMLRSTLDAVAVKAYNSRNNLIALGVLLVVAGLLLGADLAEPAMGLAWAFAAGVSAQGLLTFLTVHQVFGVTRVNYALGITVPLAVATGAAGLAARPHIDGSAAPLLLILSLEAVLAVLYFGVLFRRGVGWTSLLRERFFQRG